MIMAASRNERQTALDVIATRVYEVRQRDGSKTKASVRFLRPERCAPCEWKSGVIIKGLSGFERPGRSPYTSRRFRVDGSAAFRHQGHRKTGTCPLCGANNSLTDSAVRLGNRCDDCIEGDTDVRPR